MTEKLIDTRTAILNIAKVLMHRLGYNAFSYSDISKELSIKNAAVHYHFPAKEDLLAAIIETYIDEYITMGKQLKASNIKAEKKLAVFIERYACLIETNSICIIGSIASDYNTLPESVKEKTRQLVQLVLGLVAHIIEEGRKNGELIFAETARVKSLLMMTNLAAGVQLARITGGNDFKEIANSIISSIKK